MIGMIIIALLSIIGKVIAFDDSNLGLGLLRELAVEESRLLNDMTANRRLLFKGFGKGIGRPISNRFLDVDDYEPNLL